MDNILFTEAAVGPKLLEGKILIDCLFASFLSFIFLQNLGREAIAHFRRP